MSFIHQPFLAQSTMSRMRSSYNGIFTEQEKWLDCLQFTRRDDTDLCEEKVSQSVVRMFDDDDESTALIVWVWTKGKQQARKNANEMRVNRINRITTDRRYN